MSASLPEPVRAPSNAAVSRLAAALTALVANFPLIVQAFGKGLGHDWSYFNSLSLVVRSAVFQYGVFPTWNPWVCGGLDLLANPQSRLFSPLMLTDLALPPQIGNLFGIVAYGFLGFLAMLALLRHLDVGRVAAHVGAAVWVNGSWFGLHFAEGHIPYGPMQLMPVVIWCVLNIGSRRHLLILAATYSLFLLDGAIYALIFSTLAAAMVMLLGLVPRAEWRALATARPRWPLLTIPLGAALLALPRVLPLVQTTAERTPKLGFSETAGDVLVAALFDPLQTYGTFPHVPKVPWRFHEYGCYLSILGLALMLVAFVVKRGYLRAGWRWLIAALFFLWVGSGWLPEFNPWKLFHEIPLANHAHIQTRLLVITFMFVVVLIARALDAWRARPIAFGILAGLLTVESVVVRTYPETQLELDKLDAPGYELIDSVSIDKTIAWSDGSPRHYLLNKNVGSARCYEPSFAPTRILATDRPPFLSEVTVSGPPDTWDVTLQSVTPAGVELDYRMRMPMLMTLNLNALQGWYVRGDDDGVTLLGHYDERLEVVVQRTSGHLSLGYLPPALPWLVAAWLAGLVLLVLSWRRLPR